MRRGQGLDRPTVHVVYMCVGFELSHMRHIYPLPLSCPLRAYLSVAPAHSDISVGSTYPLCSTSPSRCLGSTPCYSPHKSVGTRSGVVPGASVDGLASWAVGAPRADCLAVPEKEGQRVSADLRSQSSQAAFPHSQERHCDDTCAFPHTRIDERASIPPTARAMSADTHHHGCAVNGRLFSVVE